MFFFILLYFTDPNEEALELATPTDPVVELLKQGAGKHENLQFICGEFHSVTLPIQFPLTHQSIL